MPTCVHSAANWLSIKLTTIECTQWQVTLHRHEWATLQGYYWGRPGQLGRWCEVGASVGEEEITSYMDYFTHIITSRGNSCKQS